MTQVQLRINNDDGGSSSFDFEADGHETILDLLETLRAKSDAAHPSGEIPAYRHSCHHGSCGSCGAVINGKEMLLCLTRVGDLANLPVITLEPLRGMAVIAGIAVHPGRVFAGIPDVTYLKAGDRHLPGTEGACHRRFEACIECGLCVSACPVRVPFIGPAALAAVNREREKNPDSAQDMARIAAAPDGAQACERHLACSRVCPQAVYPGKHIQLLKNLLAARREGL